MTELHLDYETHSAVDLRKRGLDRYTADPSTRVLLCAYSYDDGPVRLWDHGDGPFPAELRDALTDPGVIKFAFNAQFERLVTERVLKIRTPLESWRCTQALAYMMGFAGGLDEVGAQVGLGSAQSKDREGKRLIKIFSEEWKRTKTRFHPVRDELTDPADWRRFREYCAQDVVAEKGILRILRQYPVPPDEWRFYHLDQRVNDAGLPVDPLFVRNAISLAALRANELLQELRRVTGLANPNSVPQFVPWLLERGYPFPDIRKETVAKVLSMHWSGDLAPLTNEAVEALELRQWAARLSTRKYNAVLERAGDDARIRYCFQFCGASRTGRFAGRTLQPQNLMRTPKALESLPGCGEDEVLALTNDFIRRGDYGALKLFFTEPMEALTGCARSMIRAPEGHELVVCDLASIESRVIAWLTGCERLLDVFCKDRDPYKDFATEFYGKPYHAITKSERNICKPPTLGCGYGLSGGELAEDGRKTGLWAYAESMGVLLSREDAHRAVRVYHETYPEIPDYWHRYQAAAFRAATSQKDTDVGPLRFEWMKPFMAVRLPSGRRLYYHKPQPAMIKRVNRKGEEYRKLVLTYRGQDRAGKWGAVATHPGKLTENFVQAVARDVLREGLFAAEAEGFEIVGHVHDEVIALRRKGDNRRSLELLRDCMARPIPWAPGLPLGAAGYTSNFYKKD